MKNIIIVVFIISFMCSCTMKSDNVISAAGVVDGDIVTIRSKAGGTVTEIKFDDGDDTEMNDMVLKVDNAKILNSVEQQRLLLKENRINAKIQREKLGYIKEQIAFYKRKTSGFKRLYKKRAVSGDSLQVLELKLLKAETDKESVLNTLKNFENNISKVENRIRYFELVLDDHKVRSPFKGIILEVFIRRGENISPGTPAFEILDPDSLFVDIFLEQKEISVLKMGDLCTVKADGIDKNIKGKIIYFGRKAEFSPKYIVSERERKSLLYRVKIKISSQDSSALKVGMPVTVRIDK